MIKLTIKGGRLEYEGKNEFRLSDIKMKSKDKRAYKTISIDLDLETIIDSATLNQERSWKDKLLDDFRKYLDDKFPD